MSDITFRPVVSTAGSSGYCFKVECNDTVLLVDVKKEFYNFLSKKGFKIDFQVGWHEVND